MNSCEINYAIRFLPGTQTPSPAGQKREPRYPITSSRIFGFAMTYSNPTIADTATPRPAAFFATPAFLSLTFFTSSLSVISTLKLFPRQFSGSLLKGLMAGPNVTHTSALPILLIPSFAFLPLLFFFPSSAMGRYATQLGHPAIVTTSTSVFLRQLSSSRCSVSLSICILLLSKRLPTAGWVSQW